MASKWEIFHIVNCTHAKPFPKNKFLLIAYVDPQPHGFFINSRVNAYVQQRPHLMRCEASIQAADHPFLHHDSVVDCRDIFPLHQNDLIDSRGHLSSAGIASVESAVVACPVLERLHKRHILT